MVVLPILAAGFFMNLVAVLFVVCSVVLTLVVLMQKGRGGGLSAALGGAMASGLLGSKTGDFLTWVTIIVVSVFLTLAVLMARFYKPTISDVGSGPDVKTQQPAGQAQPPDSGSGAGTTGEKAGGDADLNSVGG